MSELWRVGRNIPLNVYEGDRPVCQCHTAVDARRIVAAMNWQAAECKAKERDRDRTDIVNDNCL